MVDSELKRRRLKIIQVLLLVDDLEGKDRFLLIELYDLPASSNRASDLHGMTERKIEKHRKKKSRSVTDELEGELRWLDMMYQVGRKL
ncbi:hypothetical protein P5673_020390 [Acropora cervicornis]|uniref:Uncharacterized protein n=1 Tax=Acropora cervicornis TaxID=6130 RepID=A0AAD9Q9P7_ACRCE|nr:hypothetical protein P5673_020390 [Acropora cervicornis]